MKKYFSWFAALVLCLVQFGISQPAKLVVVISLDQFRYDYLTRFQEHFGKGGFTYLLQHGANFTNATYKHAMNMTGPGHAVILSGAYGNENGIVANDWYDAAHDAEVYCVGDSSVSIIGTKGEGISPKHFIGATFGDQLKLHTNFRSKVVSISNKDRAAVLMGGKLADAAYWMVDSSFITSTYYRSDLPSWVQQFNRSGIVNSYFGKEWQRSLPEKEYAAMDTDNAAYEGGGNGLGNAFPHPTTGKDPHAITQSYYWALLTSPYGAEVLSSFAKAAINGEQLGRHSATDLLCIGFSSTDYVGHSFGPASHEVMDMTIRMDRILADLFSFLDKNVGLSRCIIVLTSDHGVAPIPEYLIKHQPGADAGRVSESAITQFCSSALANRFGNVAGGWIQKVYGKNVFLNYDMLREKHILPEDAASALADSLMTFPHIALALTRDDLHSGTGASPLANAMSRSYYPTRCGDVFFVFKPYWIEGYSKTGTTHGEPYMYDAHVPVIIAGNGIRSGRFATEASPADIGPTLSALMGVEFPAGHAGRVLTEAMTREK